MNFYWQLYGANVYDKEDYCNLVFKLDHKTFKQPNIVKSVIRDAYMGSNPVIKFDNYSWATIFAHAMMAQFVKYKFDYHPGMYAAIT